MNTVAGMGMMERLYSRLRWRLSRLWDMGSQGDGMGISKFSPATVGNIL